MRMRGFTLLELVLVIVLLGILAAASLPLLLGGIGVFSQQRETTAIEREAMVALERIAREVRMSRNVVPAGSSISFERTSGGGGLVAVTISQQGSDLVLSTGGASSVLASNVSGVSFVREGYEGACYVKAQFSTAGVSEPWRVVTYTRNESC